MSFGCRRCVVVPPRIRWNPKDGFLGKMTAKSSPLNLTRSSTEKWSCVRTQSHALSSSQCNLLCVNHISSIWWMIVLLIALSDAIHTNGSMTIIIDQADVCCVCLYLLLRHYSTSFRIVLDANALVFVFPHFEIDQLSFDDNPLFVCFFYCEEKFQRLYVMLTYTRSLLLWTKAAVAHWAAHS